MKEKIFKSGAKSLSSLVCEKDVSHKLNLGGSERLDRFFKNKETGDDSFAAPQDSKEELRGLADKKNASFKIDPIVKAKLTSKFSR